jgi:hypothetical protein
VRLTSPPLPGLHLISPRCCLLGTGGRGRRRQLAPATRRSMYVHSSRSPEWSDRGGRSAYGAGLVVHGLQEKLEQVAVRLHGGPSRGRTSAEYHILEQVVLGRRLSGFQGTHDERRREKQSTCVPNRRGLACQPPPPPGKRRKSSIISLTCPAISANPRLHPNTPCAHPPPPVPSQS